MEGDTTETAEKVIPNTVTTWERISEDFLNTVDTKLEWLKTNKPNDYDDYIKGLGDLFDKSSGKFNKSLFKSDYLEYFSKEHIPGTPYKTGKETILGTLIDNCTGASYLFGGGGVTISENGLENIERAFNKFDDFKIKKMNEKELDMKIYRLEIVSDGTVRPDRTTEIKKVRIGAEKKGS